MPTALRACLPASPNTSSSSSLAPFTTCGWPVKSGALATKPVILTTWVTADSPPVTDATAARAFSAAVRASAAASAGLTCAPTFPVSSSLPATMGNWPAVYTCRPVRTAGT